MFAFYHKMETRWIWPDSQLFLNYQVAEENIGRSLKNKLIIMTAEIQFFLYVFEWNRRSDTYQDVNQQQVLWAPALVAKKVFHAEFGRVRCETAAVPVQPVVDLRQRGKKQKLSSFATDEARARVGIYWKMGQIITICFDFNGVNKCQIGRAPLALQSGSGIREIAAFMEMTQNIMQPKQRFAFFFI